MNPEEVCEEAVEEMSALSAVFCEEAEFELVEDSAQTGLIYRIRTNIETNSGRKTIHLLFSLSPQYPRVPPDISVSSLELSKSQCQHLRMEILKKAHGLPAEPMVYQLMTWLQQNSTHLVTVNSTEPDRPSDISTEQTSVALLHLDHMRSKAKYIKAIESWTSQLDLTGRLFLGKTILILLQGTKKSIKEFIHLQRSVKVDVDSSGNRCKEKMMSVLCERPSTDHFQKISTFEIREVLSVEDLRKEFDLIGAMQLFQDYVSSLL